MTSEKTTEEELEESEAATVDAAETERSGALFLVLVGGGGSRNGWLG